jgi:hypothetical protein
MLKNNNLARDKEGEHLERVLALSQNVDTYATELVIVGDELTNCQTASADWTTAVTVAGVESGEAQEATESLNNALQKAHTYYVFAKEILLAKIYAISKPDNIVIEYGIVGETPYDYNGLYVKINMWLETNTRLVAEIDPRVVDISIITGLTAHITSITALWHDSREEHCEKNQAYVTKRMLFDAQVILLNLVFGKCKLKWGNDDPRLKDLGFVPKSEIWTEKTSPAPKNFIYDDGTGVFSWDAVEGVDLYKMDYRLTDTSGEWTTLYEDTVTLTTDKPPDPGEYDFRVRAIADNKLGMWSSVITEYFSA